MVGAKEIFSIKINEEYMTDREYGIFQNIKKDGQDGGHAQCAIIHGKNGSGKSTIARALRGEIQSAEFLDEEGNNLNLDLSKVYVFDERFIIENFRKLSEDNLRSIVLLGESVKIQSEIDDLEKEQNNKDAEIGRLKDEIETLKKDVKVVEDEIAKTLRDIKECGQDGRNLSSWRARTKYYNQGGQYKKRPNGYIEQLIQDCESFKGLDAYILKKEFVEKIETLETIINFQKVKWSATKISLPFDINKIIHVASEVIPADSLDKDDLYMRVSHSGVGAKDLASRIGQIFSENSDFCPQCFQDINAEYKENVINVINEYLRDIANNQGIQNLSNLKFDSRPNQVDLPDIKLDDLISVELKGLYDSLGKMCDEVNDRIQIKIDDPRKNVSFENLDPEDVVRRINEIYEEISDRVDEWNSQGEEVSKVRNMCDELNHKIAITETEDSICSLISLREDIKDADDALKVAEASKNEIFRILAEKRAELRNEKDAAEKVNDLLSMVFDEGGISLVPDIGGGYRVVNNGIDVPPRSLSTGEQNILSLCYFFVRIASGEDYNSSLGDNKIIVLDDPISSFDYNNKFGVIKLLGSLSRRIFQNGSESKLLIMTHDISVAYELSKMIQLVCPNVKIQCWEFCENLENANFDNIDEYKRILRQMFNFVMNKENLAPTSNDVRRVWEAFLRFELGQKTISGPESVNIIREYFKDSSKDSELEFLNSFISQVYINSDSHAARQMLEYNFTLQPTLEGRDFKKYTREILCFIHLVSPHHIASRIESKRKNIKLIREELDQLCQSVISK